MAQNSTAFRAACLSPWPDNESRTDMISQALRQIADDTGVPIEKLVAKCQQIWSSKYGNNPADVHRVIDEVEQLAMGGRLRSKQRRVRVGDLKEGDRFYNGATCYYIISNDGKKVKARPSQTNISLFGGNGKRPAFGRDIEVDADKEVKEAY